MFKVYDVLDQNQDVVGSEGFVRRPSSPGATHEDPNPPSELTYEFQGSFAGTLVPVSYSQEWERMGREFPELGVAGKASYDQFLDVYFAALEESGVTVR